LFSLTLGNLECALGETTIDLHILLPIVDFEDFASLTEGSNVTALLLVLPSPSDELMLGGVVSRTAGDIGMVVYFVFPSDKVLTFFPALGLEGVGETTNAVPLLFPSFAVTQTLSVSCTPLIPAAPLMSVLSCASLGDFLVGVVLTGTRRFCMLLTAECVRKRK
jgi:hypothetical protein